MENKARVWHSRGALRYLAVILLISFMYSSAGGGTSPVNDGKSLVTLLRTLRYGADERHILAVLGQAPIQKESQGWVVTLTRGGTTQTLKLTWEKGALIRAALVFDVPLERTVFGTTEKFENLGPVPSDGNADNLAVMIGETARGITWILTSGGRIGEYHLSKPGTAKGPMQTINRIMAIELKRHTSAVVVKKNGSGQ